MFVLYQKSHKAFPEIIGIECSAYGKKVYVSINADFRNILRIFAMLKDEDIPEDKKMKKLRDWFLDEIPANVTYEEAAGAFFDFIDKKEKDPETGTQTQKEFETEIEETGQEQQFCYDFDAKEIYADFLREYGIDLIDAGFIHWYKFKILLGNLSPESAFKRKLELRFMDLSGMDAAVSARRLAELTQAKESVQIPVPDSGISSHDLQDLKEFNEIWGKAGNN